MITAPVGDDALAELQWQPWTHANGRRTPGAEDPTLNFTTISNVGGQVRRNAEPHLGSGWPRGRLMLPCTLAPQTMLSAQPSRVWVWAWDGFRVVSDSTIDGSTLNAVQGLELCLIQGQEVPGSGVGGSAGFLVENTPWVQPAYVVLHVATPMAGWGSHVVARMSSYDLYCGGSGRRDFRGYRCALLWLVLLSSRACGVQWAADLTYGVPPCWPALSRST